MARKRSLQSLITEFGRDPERIIEALGYGLKTHNCPRSDLAACTMMMNNNLPVIHINNAYFADTDRCPSEEVVEIAVRAALGHELGHAYLQQDYLRIHRRISDGERHQIAHPLEREANVFAARLLIDLVELEEKLIEGYTYRQLAKILRVPVGFVILRLEDLKREKPSLGIGTLPHVRDNFMACIDIPDESDDLYE